ALRDELKRDLASAREREELATVQFNRIRYLFDQGASAGVDLTDSQDVLEQRKREVETLEARLKVLAASEEAAKSRLSLSRTPSNYDPSIWLRELDTKIEQENNKIRILEGRLRTAKEELNQTRKDVGNKQFIDIRFPQQGSGVLLNLMAYPGKLVQPGEVLGQVAICDNLWVDAWVKESTAQALEKKYKAEVKLHGLKGNNKDRNLDGEVVLIRSGIGRLVTDLDAAVQIDPNQAIRYAQVRIAFPDGQTTDELCNYIGYSGKVTFRRKKDSNKEETPSKAASSSTDANSSSFADWLSAFTAWLQHFPFPNSK
ncbi:MAG: HlyD family efflux transporter periplasmic adaptor subunit, partial [Symploca sp. SIO2G7]|nr:HlyD family efflux transporter periplasmic adaptor subunit [Symploca sp. SIO2G7]